MTFPLARRLSAGQRGIINGYRSGLEDKIAAQIEDASLPVSFEEVKVVYEVPARTAKYTPDFLLPNGIIIETKGRFVTADRQKMRLIKKQHPDLDIRMVFSNANTRISKTSKTTYGMWCLKNGYMFASKLIPEEWLAEPPEPTRIAAVQRLLDG